jgi:hypothetical protein
MVSICVILPTRDRPQDFLNSARSVAETSTTAQVVAYVDDDQMGIYAPLRLPERTQIHYGPRVGVALAVNAVAHAHPRFGIYGLTTDDSVYLTPGWDDYAEQVFDGYKNGIGVLSAAHLAGRHVNFPFVSREWIDACGWFAYPKAYHFCWDTILELLGEATKITFAPKDKFLIRHDWQPPLNLDHTEADCRAFLWWCVTERTEIVARLRKAME